MGTAMGLPSCPTTIIELGFFKASDFQKLMQNLILFLYRSAGCWTSQQAISAHTPYRTGIFTWKNTPVFQPAPPEIKQDSHRRVGGL
jgi:hypothetical protein